MDFFGWTSGEIPSPRCVFDHIPYFRFIAAHPGAAAPTTSTNRSMSCSGMRLTSMLPQYRHIMKAMSCASRSVPRLQPWEIEKSVKHEEQARETRDAHH